MARARARAAPEQEGGQWPAYVVVRKPLAWLKPYERNARTHSDAQIAQLRGSLKKFGWTIPVLAREDGTIIAGHGRVEAAKREGLTECPVIVATGWSEEQCRAYALADNRIALNSGWDEDILGLEVADLSGLGLDLDTLGFSPKELGALLPTDEHAGLADPDAASEVPKNPVATRGDLWALGRHWLVCGDATDANVHAVSMGGAVADVILTDPPYCSGGFQESKRVIGSIGTDRKKGARPTISRDNLTTEGLEALITSVIRNVESAGCCYAFCDWRQFGTIRKAIEPLGYQFRALLIWDKETPGMGGPWRHQYEMVFFGTRRKEPPTGKSGDVLKAKRSGNDLHPTQKPVELITKIIENTVGEHIVDPFAGSGTTIIAAEMTGRICHAIEIDPGFVDVCIKRWQDFTGKKATLDGLTFDEIAAERIARAA